MILVRILITLALSLPTFVFASNSLPNAKIAILDIQSVLDNSIAIKHLRTSIDTISEQFAKELSAKEMEFKEMGEGLEKKRASFKPEQFEKEVEGFYKKLSAFQHETQKKKEKLERAHSAAIEFVHEHTIKIVHEVSREKGFNIALPMSQTLYAADVLNITSEVTQRLNQKVTEVQLKY